MLGADALAAILNAVRKSFSVDPAAEITFEANPDSVDLKLLRRLRAEGFNRVSLGIQCDDDRILKALGRPHSFSDAMDAVEKIRRAGFKNLSVDLMYGLPGQTLLSWRKTLQNVVKLKPEHISCYGLKLEEGTYLHTYQDHYEMADDDTQADMYLSAVEILRDKGYRQYEISNFCRKGQLSLSAEVGDLILAVAFVPQDLHGGKVHIRLGVIVCHFVVVLVGVQVGTLLQLQTVAADMLRLQLDHILQGLSPGKQGLPGQTVHQIHGKILKACPADLLHRVHGIGKAVGATQGFQDPVVITLDAQAHPVKALCPEPPQQLQVHGIRVGFKGDLCGRVHGKAFPHRIQNSRQGIGAQHGGGAAAKINGVHPMVGVPPPK